jgi:hypothetical protein
VGGRDVWRIERETRRGREGVWERLRESEMAAEIDRQEGLGVGVSLEPSALMDAVSRCFVTTQAHITRVVRSTDIGYSYSR